VMPCSVTVAYQHSEDLSASVLKVYFHCHESLKSHISQSCCIIYWKLTLHSQSNAVVRSMCSV